MPSPALRRRWFLLRNVLFTGFLAAALPAAALETPPLLGSFSGNSSTVIGLAVDDATGEIFAVGSSSIERYSATGTFLGSIPLPAGPTASVDLDFSTTSLDIAGTVVPANSLLLLDDEGGLREFFALDKTTGAVLASTTYPNTPGTPAAATLVGMAVDGTTGTILTLAHDTDEMGETDLATGALADGPFDVAPSPPTTFSINFGDIDVATNGDIYLISSEQERIRVFGPHGDLKGDIAFTGGNLRSGLALDEATGTVWYASTTGANSTLFHLTLPAPGGTATLIESCSIPQFNTLALAISPTTGNLFALQGSAASVIDEFTAGASCVLQGSIGWPNIIGSSAIDLDILESPLDVGGTIVPAGSLIGLDEFTTPRFNAIALPGGGGLAGDTLPNLPSGSNVGLARSEWNGFLHTVNFTTQRVHIVDAADGSLPADSFSVEPPQFFDVFNGDVEIYEGGDFVLVVGSGTSAIRVFSRDGDFLGDMGLGHLGITDLSGIAIHPTTREIWLSTDSPPAIYHLPEPASPISLIAGAIGCAAFGTTKRRQT